MGKEDVAVSFRLPVATIKEGDYIVSVCQILDVCSQGENEKEAIDNLAEALQLFIETCYEMGTLEQVLKDCGFNSLSPRTGGAPPPEHQFIEIPFELKSSQMNAQLVAG